ncbi:MAG: T9SS type A sorting domain-containing protein [Calditrichales bacterium]|nr:T9SS type A sorting domain-containing protein [Calditrichales bacterium]
MKGLTTEQSSSSTFIPDGNIPQNYSLHQNYPNPFNPATTINYDLPKTSNVVLRVYDLIGQEVKTLVNDIQTAGEKSVVWNGRNSAGQIVSSGVYIYSLQAGNEVHSRKMIFAR